MSNSLAEFGYDIGIEAQEGDHEGDLPSLVTIAWENTEDVKNLAGFFTLVKGVLAVSEAQCITHKVSTTTGRSQLTRFSQIKFPIISFFYFGLVSNWGSFR